MSVSFGDIGTSTAPDSVVCCTHHSLVVFRGVHCLVVLMVTFMKSIFSTFAQCISSTEDNLRGCEYRNIFCYVKKNGHFG